MKLMKTKRVKYIIVSIFSHKTEYTSSYGSPSVPFGGAGSS